MRADARLATALLVAGAPTAAWAQTDPKPAPVITLTEAGAPTARPWEKAAIVSATIDRDGDDYFEVHANGDVQFDLLSPPPPGTGARTRTATLGPSLKWDRSTRTGKKQNDLRAGAVFYYYDEPDLGTVDPNANPLLWAAQANVDYSYAAVYPDTGKAPCDVANASPLCEVQHKSSIRGKLSVFPYLAGFEDQRPEGPGVYSFRPQLQIAHDQIVDATRDATTLAKVTGEYTSVLVGAGLNVRPKFVSPQFEVNAIAQLRQRIAISDSRRASVESSAERFEVSATYYVAQADRLPETKDWRIGLSLTWIEGGDPFENLPSASTITLGVRIGRF